MREIKFRYRIQEYPAGKIVIDYFNLDDYGVKMLDRRRWKILSRDQYTGLRDRNGVKIYEGDILLLIDWYGPPSRENGFGVVTFKECAFGFVDQEAEIFNSFSGLIKDSMKDDYLEVIGNIYENPELIAIKKEGEG